MVETSKMLAVAEFLSTQHHILVLRFSPVAQAAASQRPNAGSTWPASASAIRDADEWAIKRYALSLRHVFVKVSTLSAMAAGSSASIAAITSLSCSGRLGPMIAAVISGLERIQAIASVVSDMPASCARGRRASTASNCSLCQYLSRYMSPLLPARCPKRVSSIGGASRACFPVSSPPASGL